MPKCHNRILVHYADILWAAIHRDYRDCVNFLPKVSKIFKTYFLSYQRDKFVKTFVQPSSSLPEHQLQPSWGRIFSISNNQKTRVDSDINSDYKTSSFDKLYIRRRKWDTAGFVRAHQRKYWNALTAGLGHADDGCSCNHRAVPPSGFGRIRFSRYKLKFILSFYGHTQTHISMMGAILAHAAQVCLYAYTNKLTISTTSIS